MTRQPSEPVPGAPLVPGAAANGGGMPVPPPSSKGAAPPPPPAKVSATKAPPEPASAGKPSGQPPVATNGQVNGTVIAAAEEPPRDEPHPWLKDSASMLVSTAIHTIIFLLLLLVPVATMIRESRYQMELGQTAAGDVQDMSIPSALDDSNPLGGGGEGPVGVPGEINPDLPMLDHPLLGMQGADSTAVPSPTGTELGPLGAVAGTGSDMFKSAGTGASGGLDGRGSPERRAQLAKSGGGNTASEDAVNKALKWLAIHQLPDGGWNFDLMKCPNCRGKCQDSGTMENARIAATAMALLPFLGAGQTHKKGDYQKQVHDGLYFLISRMKTTNTDIGSLYEPGGTMYSHGLATIVLCEAFGMTDDRQFLMRPAQRAINFIVFAQDPEGGGWRYNPQQAGDTSVLGWQVMALKSAEMAYLHVPDETMRKAMKFLDDVQADLQSDTYSKAKYGVAYGYTYSASQQRCEQGTTAIGLLCRMYLGWKYDNPAILRGTQLLGEFGPSNNELQRNYFDVQLGVWQRGDPIRTARSPGGSGAVTNMYYNYYATQVMHNVGGEPWKKWNTTMRDFLVSTQAQDGHEAGSWFMNDVHGSPPGGRLYCTALATMILEVYYRYMPLYQQQTFKDDFPTVK